MKNKYKLSLKYMLKQNVFLKELIIVKVKIKLYIKNIPLILWE